MNAIMTIAREVARFRGVALKDLLSDRRDREIVRPRQEAMYCAKALTPASLPAIGRRLGGRDHTTVLHSVRITEARIAEEAGYGDQIEAMLAAIRGTLPGEGTFELVAAVDIDVKEAAQRIHQAIAAGERVSVYADEVAAIAERMLRLEQQGEALQQQLREVSRPATAVTIVANGPMTPLCEAAVKAVLAAHTQLENDRFSGRERFSQAALERALTALKSTFQPEGPMQ